MCYERRRAEACVDESDHHRVVSRNPCESLSLILRQWLLWANISAGVTLQRSVSCCPSCCPSCSLALASLCGLAAAVGSGGQRVVACAFPTSPARCCVLRRAGTPGKSCNPVLPWKIPSHCNPYLRTTEPTSSPQTTVFATTANSAGAPPQSRHQCLPRIKVGGSSPFTTPQYKRLFINVVMGTFFEMSESGEASGKPR